MSSQPSPASSSSSPERAARPTLRCLESDLGIALPSRDVDLGSLDHPVLRKGREHAQSFPKNQIRIEEITDAFVYRFTHGRYRVADWGEEGGCVWVCASEIRRAGARDDAYEYILGLHAADELLPMPADDERYEAEAAQRLLTAIRQGVPHWVDDARAHEEQERAYRLPGGAVVYLYIRSESGYEEIWVAMPVLSQRAVGLPPTARGFLLAELMEVVGDAEWDQVHEWPTRSLQAYEIAHLGLR